LSGIQKLLKRNSKLSTQPTQTEIFAELFDQLPDDKFAKPQLQVQQQPDVDVAAEFKAALADPLLYPPLAQSVFPGDAVAIVLQTDLPHPLKALTCLLEQLYQLKIESTDIVVVVSAPTAIQV